MTSLHQVRDRLQADILSQVRDGVIAVDAAGVIVLWNSGAQALLQIRAQTALGQSLRRFPSLDWIMEADASPPGERGLRLREFGHVRADGRRVEVEASVSPLRDDNGGKMGLLVILRDVSEHKRYEGELLEARRRAELANLAKSEFLATMSHEIRTPLSGILGMTQLALNLTLPENVKEFLQLVHQSGKALLDIVNDTLDLSKIEADRVALEKKPFDLVEMIESTLTPLGLQARDKGLSFRYSIACDAPPRVVGDQGRLRQILTNVVGNAVKFTKRGMVEVDVRRQETGDPRKVRLIFCVRDDGIGIAEAQIPAIFEKFGQAASASDQVQCGGTGLGLAIAKALVEMMDGSIAVESELDKGSTFFLDLELEKALPHDADPPPARPSGQDSGPGSGPALRVLVAEDNQVNSLFACHILEGWGHTVETACNGRQALEKLRASGFDLVLMDALMPIMDGEQATRLIRSGQAGNPDIPIVALTAHALQGDRERFLAAGMNDYISKPIDVEALRRVLQRIGQTGGPPQADGPI